MSVFACWVIMVVKQALFLGSSCWLERIIKHYSINLTSFKTRRGYKYLCEILSCTSEQKTSGCKNRSVRVSLCLGVHVYIRPIWVRLNGKGLYEFNLLNYNWLELINVTDIKHQLTWYDCFDLGVLGKFWMNEGIWILDWDLEK